MQKNKILFSISLFLTLCLFLSATKQSYASFNTTVQTQSWVHASGSSAKMGTTTLYAFNGPSGERSPQFFSSVMASVSSDRYFNVYRLRIEVSAKDPNNNQIPGAHIGIIGAYVSPGDQSDPVREGFLKIYNVLLAAIPYGLGELLKQSNSNGGVTPRNDDPTIAYAEWSYPLLTPLQWEKGLEFGFSLNIQPTATLEGIYRIYVHYKAEIFYSGHMAPPNPAHVFDLYDTLEYNYVNKPSQPSQPSPSVPPPYYRNIYYSFSTTAFDPNNDQLQYTFYWGDGSSTTTPSWYTPGVIATMSHSWSVPNTYQITVRAIDNTGAWSELSAPLTIQVTNRIPNTPSTPSGTTSGYRCVSYTYSSSTTDPDGDNIRYQFELSGPITTRTYTTGYYASGATGSAAISWQTADPPGTYYVRVHAQDVCGAWSSWSSYLTVHVYNRAPNTPSTPAGPSSGSPGVSYTYSTSTVDLDGDNVCYQFDWGDSSSTTTGWYASGVTVYASHGWSYDGTYSVRVKAKDVYGDWSAWSSTRTVYITSGGGGGCPYVYTWDGQDYLKDNNLLPASEILNGTDTKDYYKLEQMLVPVFSSQQTSTYTLQIREFESEIDYIDQVKLIAVDHSEGTSIAVTPEGKILTYTAPASPISCIDNEGVDRLSEITTMNGDVGDASTYFQGYKDDWLVLNFGTVTGPYAKLILRDDQKCCDVCINVQVLNPAGKWVTVEVLHPRDFWSMEAVDMSPFVPKTGDFKVRLLWTTAHRLDYVGLDTSPPAEVKLSSATPTQATHSEIGDVTALLLRDDGRCTKLVSGQQVTMTFTIPNEPQDTVRDFIFYTNGYYYTIAP